MDATTSTRTAYRTCPLCEAGCGLEITLTAKTRSDASDRSASGHSGLRGRGTQWTIVRIRGDRDDVFTRGYICPKGSTLKQLHEDPDRLRTPAACGATASSSRSTWDEAFAEIERRLLPVLDAHGRDAVGRVPRQPERPQPRRHALQPAAPEGARHHATSSRRSTVDQRPKEMSSALMFGGGSTSRCPTSTAPTTC